MILETRALRIVTAAVISAACATLASAGATVQLSLAQCHAATDLAGVEMYLRQARGVRDVSVNRGGRGGAVAYVTIDPALTSALRLRDGLRRAGYACVSIAAATHSPAEHHDGAP